jgi:hypothetical protein
VPPARDRPPFTAVERAALVGWLEEHASTRFVKVAPEYGASALWVGDGSMFRTMSARNDLPISDELAKEIDEWDVVFDDTYNRAEPQSSGFPTRRPRTSSSRRAPGSPADSPRSSAAMRYDRGRQSLDRHATYVVAAFVAGTARCE